MRQRRSNLRLCSSLAFWGMLSTSCFAGPTIDQETVVQICQAFTKKTLNEMPAVVPAAVAQKVVDDYGALSVRLRNCLSAAESNRSSNSVRFLIQSTQYESYWNFAIGDSSIETIEIERYRPVTLAEDTPWKYPVPGSDQNYAHLTLPPLTEIHVQTVSHAIQMNASTVMIAKAAVGSTAHSARRNNETASIDQAIKDAASPSQNVVVSPPEPRLVEFYYATTRKQLDPPTPSVTGQSAANPSAVDTATVAGWTDVTDYTGERNGSLSFGAIRIRVPDKHSMGKIELPTDLKIFGLTIWHETANQTDHFIIRSVRKTDEAKWISAISATNGGKDAKNKRAIIFVHGFNTKFGDAAFRTAQIVWDLQFRGTAVLFSWPSRGDIADYLYDKDSALGSRDALLQVVNDLNKAGITDISIIAHSMGNLVTVDALANSASTPSPAAIAQLVMAAPDVDRDMFIGEIPKVAKVTKGLTLYASSKDKALQLSKRVAGNIPRAGDVPPMGPVVLSPLVTIDVSALGDELFGLDHSTFATARNVLDDLKLLLDTGAPAPRLAEIHGFPDPPEAATYFRYVP